MNLYHAEEPLRCAGFQGTPLDGFAGLKEVPPRCSKWRRAEAQRIRV
ncbi:hypothetical protein [Nostoc sp. UHCC 0302]